MTLTAGDLSASEQGWVERRGMSREPRRSWASAQPFVVRATPQNSDPERLRASWRRRGSAYVAQMILLDLALTVVVMTLLLGPTFALLPGGLVSGAVAVSLVAGFGGYTRGRAGDGPSEYQAVLRASLTFAVVLGAAAYLLGLTVPRHAVLLSVPALALGVGLVHYLCRRSLHDARRRGDAAMSTVVVGQPADVHRVIADLALAPQHGYRVDGVCLPTLDTPDRVDGVPVLGAVADVVQVVADHAVDVVLVTGGTLSGDALRRLSWAVGRAGAHLVVVPDLVEVSGPRLRVRPTAGLSLLEVEVGAPRRRLLLKSVLDRVVGAGVLLAALPVLAVVALAVRLDSPGPVLFRQTRVGVDGRRFTMLKIRTMRVDADQVLAGLSELNEGAGVLFKMREDPRVTRVGRVLRRLSIDELPQLWNVVRGDMSLVGPRPPLEREVEAYEDEVQRRLHVKPGLTGLWQVSGRSNLDWDASVRLDLRYVDNWSVAMDLMILWRTGRAVLRGVGAY